MIAGADGCKAGWFVLLEQGNSIISTVLPTAEDILDRYPELEVLAIDIPIGIPDAGSRQCDIEVRRLLKQRRNSVFPAPIRPTFNATSYESACDLHHQADGRRLSKQAHAILPKIIEVDETVRSHSLGAVVYEVHPEVSFAAMKGMQPLAHYKRTLLGLNQRLALVGAEFGERAFELVREAHPRQVGDDDILDAFAALWSARRIRKGSGERLPRESSVDNLGVRMHIHY
jgi:predicted RNase H-like nuclease